MKKIGICGHYGFGYNLYNGQTTKTRHVTEALSEEFGEDQIFCVDTHGGGRAVFRICLQTFQMFRKCRNIIFLPAHHALLFLVPLFSVYQRIFPRSLHYIVIGGWLSQFLEQHRWLYRIMEKMTGIYVETMQMKKMLEEKGLTNTDILPNFKMWRTLQEDELVYCWESPYRLCTFSRIEKEKGIEDAVAAVKLANERLKRTVFYLDIYGYVEKAYIDRWSELKRTFPEYIRYRGAIPEENSTNVLKDYYALLFPTYFSREGFAGVLIDAMNAGVPVIASDWNYNREIICDGNTGILIPPNDHRTLADILEKIYQDPKWWNEMKINALKAARRYSPEESIRALTSKLK